MPDPYQLEDIAEYNEYSLKALVRAIKLSQGQWRLILVRCNYGSLRAHIVERLRELSPVEIRELILPEGVKSVYTTIKVELRDEVPQALMIFGLESVSDLRTVLTSSNYIREEFNNNFPFPLIVWINDEVLIQLIRLAPDLESWATSIEFTLATDELLDFLRQKTDKIFAGDSTPNLESYFEVEVAWKDLQGRGEALDPELEADLQFLLGLDADSNDKTEESRQYYERSLAFWLEQLRIQESVGAALLMDAQREDAENLQFNPPLFKGSIQNPKLVERVGCLLFYLGLWWRKYGTQHRSEYRFACHQARDYFKECIQVFERGNRPDLMAKFINPLGEVLQKLEQWDELEVIAKLAVKLHQTYYDPIRLAYGYGLLAELTLFNEAWRFARQFAKLALQTNAKASKLACKLSPKDIKNGCRSQQHDQNLYLLLLAQAQEHLGQVQKAIKILEVAKANSKPQYDPSLYIRILATLRSLYFKQGRYQEAFRIKQKQREIEYQYGFRAFIGASQLQSRCQVTNPAIALMDQSQTIAEEIAASGRQRDISRLIERLSRTDYKLIVIHGPSGVGKSSLVTAGLVPTLKQRMIGDRDVLPLVLRVYTNWVRDLGKSLLRDLGTSLVNGLSELRGINVSISNDFPQFIIKQLRKNADRNLITVLIFDQIEEFFFAYTDPEERCILYTFLRDCLEIPYVKVILSLREDYLHYLLEFERWTNLEIINNNILDKKARYYLGNFSPEEAKAVIHSLNERSQFYLESALIDKLVQDLAGNTGEVSPIELQVVGAQLHTEAIVTLEEYQRLGPNSKQRLVEQFLQQAIKDCGPPNERTALLVLYLLTEENGTRPLKTRAELAAGLENLDLETQAEQLDLVLEIMTRSGLLILLPEASSDRYQLVHDYLVSFIHQQKSAELMIELKKEKDQLNNFLKQQQRIAASACFTLAVLAALVMALVLQSQFQRREAEAARNKAEQLQKKVEQLQIELDAAKRLKDKQR